MSKIDTKIPLRWFTPILYSEVFDRKPTRDNLADLVRKINWHDLAAKCSAIALLSWQHGIEDPKQQTDLVANLLKSLPTYAPKINDMLKQHNPQRVLFTRDTLLALFRVAIVEQSEALPMSEQAFSDAFTRAALAANEFIADELLPFTVTRSATDLLASELRSMIVQIENPHKLLGRTRAFFEWSKTPKARHHPDHLSVEDDLRRFTGLTPLEFAAGAYIVLARTSGAKTIDQLMQLGVVFNFDRWMAGVSERRIPRAWLDVSSINIETIREEWQEEPSLSFAGAGTLYRRPVLLEDDLYIAPTPDLLANAMGDGTYFALLDGYSSVDKKKFTRYYGAFFEDYIASIFERGYASRTDADLWREEPFKPGAVSTDVIINEAGDMLFIEVVAKRMNLVSSVLRLNPEAIEKDLRRGVMKKLWQLHKNIEHYRNKTLFPQMPRTPGQRIFPILVAPKDWPRVYVINEPLKKAQESQGLLPGTEPVEFLTMGEVESIESDLTKGLPLAQILHRKNNSTPHNRLMPLNNYLIDVEQKVAVEPSLALSRGNAAAQEVIHLVKSWGLAS